MFPPLLQYSDWGQGKNSALFMFENMGSGDADSKMLNPRQSGDLQLKLRFIAPPGKDITVLIYGEFENMFENMFGALMYNIYERS